MLGQIGLLVVFVLVQIVVAAAVASLYFRVFFLDQLLRSGRVSTGLHVMTLVQVLVMALVMVLLFERLLIFFFPSAPEPSFFWLNARLLIVSFTFIGNFYMQLIEDRRRLGAMLKDRRLVERIVRESKEKQDKDAKPK